MNALQFAFARAIGARTVKTAQTLRQASPLRRKALARKLGAGSAPLDNASLDRLATAQPVTLREHCHGYGLVSVSAVVPTFSGMVEA